LEPKKKKKFYFKNKPLFQNFGLSNKSSLYFLKRQKQIMETKEKKENLSETLEENIKKKKEKKEKKRKKSSSTREK